MKFATRSETRYFSRPKTDRKVQFLLDVLGNSILCTECESGLLRAAQKVETQSEAEGFSILYKAQTPVFAQAAERKRVFAFETIQNGFEVTDVLLIAICFLSFF